MRLAVVLSIVLSLAAFGVAADDSPPPAIEWGELPSLPDDFGFAGSFAGVSGGRLIVAGGANFCEGSNWEGNPKVWHDRVFVLSKDGKRWTTSTPLARPLAYGASVTWKDKVVCLGGSDAERHYADAFTLRWDAEHKRIETDELPPLPQPCAQTAAVLVGDTVYVAGGIARPDAVEAMKNFWRLDLSKKGDKLAWEHLPAWPGSTRLFPVMAVCNEKIYLFSGAALKEVDGTVERRYRRDGFCFDPKKYGKDSSVGGSGPLAAENDPWSKTAELPRPVVAAPAFPLGPWHIAVVGGDDGTLAAQNEQLKDKHPGFPPSILLYNMRVDRWTTAADFPKDPGPDSAGNPHAGTWPPVTTSVVPWGDGFAIPSGEVRPGTRTPRVLTAKFAAPPAEFGRANWGVLFGYLAVLVAMGIYFASRESSTNDFFLGGNRIPWWAAGLSIFGTQLSAITYLSVPAWAFDHDWARSLLNVGILCIAPLLICLYLPFYRRLGITTAYEYLEMRFSLSVRLLGSVSFIVFQLMRMGIVVLLPALALSAATGIDLRMSIILMGVLSTLYTVLGGIEAVIWTDVLQVVVLIGGAIAAIVIICMALPGDGGQPGGLVQIALEGAQHGKLDVIHPSWDLNKGTDSLAVMLLAVLCLTLAPYTADQAVVQRYLTTPTEKAAARAIWTNGWLSIVSTVLFFGVGTALFVFYRHHAAALVPLAKNDQVFPWFIAQEMPPGLAGLVIAGVFAAAMSSLDSSMHSIATTVTTDFVRRFRPQRSERFFLNVARLLTVLLGIAGTATALALAPLNIQSLWQQFLEYIGLLLGTVAGLFALGMFTRRATSLHAWLAAAASLAAVVYVKLETDTHSLLYATITMGTVFFVGLLTSWIIPLTRKPLRGLTIYTLEKNPNS